ncbi:hypothetical protein [Roseomonas fluvialis]|uniref:Uncharacterized protein n=1 Tax=Roseomonas fluvialis TaxID=1750527 RepID=A0ABM8ZET6_9PROT|nr:hypothetical protein [Roseomonas fluvialis]BDG73793.1 hypothetical protein Rmf_37220 [Roseomonas fluvialis]
MGSELAVPLFAMMGAVILAGIVDEAAMPAFMSLGSLAMLVGLLIWNGSIALPPNQAVALGFVGAGFALFGHVRGAPRRT